ncbi:hypothetical protein [Streptomyces sp. NPDC017868]|uniref:hypothetical protein n=1 Tax=Streptomyces sp. NPDC017868 TaxID=3365014 RepID=UPI00379A9A40
MFRTTRATAAFAALLGLVLGLLVCGVSSPAFPGETAPVFPGETAPVDTAPVVTAATVPGCDPGHLLDEGAPGPVVPPRAHGFAELLPALAADRVAPGVRQPDPGTPAVPPGREPPACVPLSPVELKVLRV